MDYLLVSMLALAVVFLMCWHGLGDKLAEKAFLFMFTVSTIFYGFAGIWYWIEFKDGVFLGVDWRNELPRVQWSFICVYIFAVALFWAFSRVWREGGQPISWEGRLTPKLMGIVNAILILGLFASIYAYATGSALREDGIELTADPLLLVAYQFSELPIAVVVFMVGAGLSGGKSRILAVIYIIFAIFVGFRYRILLALAPLFFVFYMTSRMNRVLLNFLIIFVSSLAGVFFGIMTLIRTKFGGLDWAVLDGITAEDFLYGFFADANIVFGLASALNTFDVTVPFAGFSPIADAVLQWVPRFMYPEKNLYSHLWDVNFGLGNSVEAMFSGTAMPFFGEYYASLGWVGVGVGVIFYVLMVLWTIGKIKKYSMHKRHLAAGAALVAVFFGYYYFSRGSIAQISKSYLFIIMPYLFLSRLLCTGSIAFGHSAARTVPNFARRSS